LALLLACPALAAVEHLFDLFGHDRMIQALVTVQRPPAHDVISVAAEELDRASKSGRDKIIEIR
jgi:hypothetical protein